MGWEEAFIDAVDEAMKRIAAIPDASMPVPGVAIELGARRVFVKRFPYAVVFIDLGESLSVVAFAHQRPAAAARLLGGPCRDR